MTTSLHPKRLRRGHITHPSCLRLFGLLLLVACGGGEKAGKPLPTEEPAGAGAPARPPQVAMGGAGTAAPMVASGRSGGGGAGAAGEEPMSQQAGGGAGGMVVAGRTTMPMTPMMMMPEAGKAGTAAAQPNVDTMMLATSLAAAVCDTLQMCLRNPAGVAWVVGREDCRTQFTASLSQDDFGGLADSVAAGHVVIDSAALEECYRDTRALGCGLRTEHLAKSCEQAIAGKRAVGESCRINAECVSGSFCPIAGMCPRVCTAVKARDAACTRDDECERGLSCASGKCSTPAADGAACGGAGGPACQLGSDCVGGSDTAVGKCQRHEALLSGALGASCNLSGGPLCGEGLSCGYDGTAAFTCQAQVAQGAACHLGTPGQCAIDSYCNAKDLTSAGVCAALPGDAKPCVLGTQCAPGHVCITSGNTGMCHKFANLTEACGANQQCRSGTCAEGHCVVRQECR